ncbi:MAG: (d)CMP kinase [Saprospiraceae bacterium]
MKEKQKKYRIAVDGVSGSGKSTLSKDVAKSLNYLYIDTGAMYRAITYKLLKSNVDLSDSFAIKKILDTTQIEFEIVDGRNNIILDGVNIEDKIRLLDVSSHVSEVAAILSVRKYLVLLQKEYSKVDGIVMDGRDIGTVVMPDADFKFFITADINIRAKRRYEELLKSNSEIKFDDVLNNLTNRDNIDSNRENSPLTVASDAIVIDTSKLSMENQLKVLLSYIK